MSKVAFCTLGCKVNQYETEAMITLFKEKGYEIVDFGEGQTTRDRVPFLLHHIRGAHCLQD